MDKKILFWFILGFVFVGLLTLVLHNTYKPTSQSKTLTVVTSFYPLYFFTQQIGGDKAKVVTITPPGAEPHDYEPTAKDIAEIETSNMLVLNGGGLETWGNGIQQNLNGKHTLLVIAGEGLINQQVVEGGETITDPHAWLSPLLAKQMADKITQGFTHIDPSNKDYYVKNANSLKKKLDDVDKEYKDRLTDCKEKSIITSHAAFGYLAEAYGLQQVPISGLSPDAEPSPQQLADIVKFAKAHNAKHIFFESLVSPKLSDTIATEIGAKTLVLNPIEGLTDQEISQGKSYFTEMESNLSNLQIALQCQR